MELQAAAGGKPRKTCLAWLPQGLPTFLMEAATQESGMAWSLSDAFILESLCI